MAPPNIARIVAGVWEIEVHGIPDKGPDLAKKWPDLTIGQLRPYIGGHLKDASWKSIGTLKDSSLASIIGYVELTKSGLLVRESTGISFEVLLIIAITVLQEQRTERALQALRDLSSPRALVVRGAPNPFLNGARTELKS